MNLLSESNKIKLIQKNGTNRFAKTILIVGVFHGEEPQGKYIIDRYVKDNNKKSRNHLHFIPCFNPWGYQRGIRGNIHGVDLNRNYPTKNWKLTEQGEFYSGESPASEMETRFMIEVLERTNPNIILTLHAPLNCVNFDGPARDIANKISKITQYPVQEDIGYPTPGSFGTYCGIERNIPTITLEFDGEEPEERLYEKTKPAIDYLANL